MTKNLKPINKNKGNKVGFKQVFSIFKNSLLNIWKTISKIWTNFIVVILKIFRNVRVLYICFAILVFLYLLFFINFINFTTLFKYFGIYNVGVFIGVFTFLYFLLYLFVYLLQDAKKTKFKWFNWWTIISVYFVILSVSLSLLLAVKLIPSTNIIYEKETNLSINDYNEFTMDIYCNNKYGDVVKESFIRCSYQIKDNNETNNILFYRLKVEDTTEQYFNKTDGEFKLYIPNAPTYNFDIYLEYDNNGLIDSKTIKHFDAETEDKLTVISIREKKVTILYAILSFTLSFSIFGIFGGFKNFKDLIDK